MCDEALLTALTARYMEALGQRLGHEARIIEGGKIVYSVDDCTFVIHLASGLDPQAMRLLCLFPIEGEPVERLRHVANAVNRENRAATVGASERGLLISVEMPVAGYRQLPGAEHLAAVLPVAMRAILRCTLHTGRLLMDDSETDDGSAGADSPDSDTDHA